MYVLGKLYFNYSSFPFPCLPQNPPLYSSLLSFKFMTSFSLVVITRIHVFVYT